MFLGFDMRKCWATWAGSRLNRILLLSSFTFSMSPLSSSAWTPSAHKGRRRGEVSDRSKVKLTLCCPNTMNLYCSSELKGRCNCLSLSLEGDNDLQTRQTLTVILKIETHAHFHDPQDCACKHTNKQCKHTVQRNMHYIKPCLPKTESQNNNWLNNYNKSQVAIANENIWMNKERERNQQK